MKNWIEIKACKKLLLILLYLAAAGAVVLLCGFLFKDWKISALCGVMLFITLEFRITFTKNMPSVILSVFSLGMSCVIFYLMQQSINSGISNIGVIKLIINILIVFGIISFIRLVCGKLKVAIIATIVVTQVIGVANNLVSAARGMEIQFSDLRSIKTATEVADQYSLSLNGVTCSSIVLCILIALFILFIRFPKKERSVGNTIASLTGIVTCALCITAVYTQIGASYIGYTATYWDFSGSLHNGFFVNFIYSAANSRISEPEGYDSTLLESQVNELISGDSDKSDSSYPNVIVIMNETFSDVHNVAGSLGNEMKTNVDIMPFFDSLDDNEPNIIKGHALTSAYGGNTANAEYEFLTGLSMHFYPRNSVAYSLYVDESNSFTVIDNFNAAGYDTVSIHPEEETNWQRNSVYKNFGFDSSYFIDDFDYCTDEDRFRGHISDRAVYDKIIELYENKDDGTPLFNFSITMQNHGGYITEGFEPTVTADGAERELNEYLSCVNDSDTALKELIDYFEKQEEKTVILFFGDHQPSISSIPADYLEARAAEPVSEEAKYVVPYLFYANYDIDCDTATSFTSLNFLSSWLIDIAGAPKTDFNKYVKHLNREVLAINAIGWFDHDYNFHKSDYNAPDLIPSLELYSYLHYNAVFDEDDRITSIFTCNDKK